MRTLRLLIVVATTAFLPAVSIVAAPFGAGVDPAAPVALSARFSLGAETEVPGKALKPGAYAITVVNQIADRVILRVSTPNGKVATTFLGIFNPALSTANRIGPISWTAATKDDSALRGFAFPGSKVVEFVYPKAEAVTLAKANSAKVLAIDPESDNLHLKHNQLTPDEMLVVTLWSLNSTRVGPNDEPAIEATRYQAPQTAAAVQVAALTTASGAPAHKPSPAYAQLASNAHRPVIGSLPHTADNVTAPLLVSLLAFAAFGLLYYRRFRAEA